MFDEDYNGHSDCAEMVELIALYYDDLLTVGSKAYNKVMDFFKELNSINLDDEYLPF